MTLDAGINLIKSFEGKCYTTAYRCPAGVPTIGWGHTNGVYMGMTITEAQAVEFFKQDLAKFEKAVEKWNSLYNWKQNEFDALVSFCFNLGAGIMPSFVKNGSLHKDKLADRLLEYDNAKNPKTGKKEKLAGLTRRRKAERAMFLGQTTNNTSSGVPTLKMGSKGAEVKLAQTLLRDAGYDVGAIDGIFGKRTDAAVRKFQSDHIDVCKTIDGIIGAKTWSILQKK